MIGAGKLIGGGAGGGGLAYKPQNVFSVEQYSGNSAQTNHITGVDMTRGGTIIAKAANLGSNNWTIVNSVRGLGKALNTNTSSAEYAITIYDSFNANGYTLDAGSGANDPSGQFAAWSFARASRFHDVVSWVGDGTGNRAIPHALGIKPGLMWARSVAAANWYTYHRIDGATKYMVLNGQAMPAALATVWGNTEPDLSSFTVGSTLNASGVTYIAFLWAHDPDTVNGIIQCGSLYSDATTGNATVTLGWQPQFVLLKETNFNTNSWYVIDSTRSMANPDMVLYLDLTNSTNMGANWVDATTTGFNFIGNSYLGTTWDYMAIRNPM